MTTSCYLGKVFCLTKFGIMVVTQMPTEFMI